MFCGSPDQARFLQVKIQYPLSRMNQDEPEGQNASKTSMKYPILHLQSSVCRKMNQCEALEN